MLQRAVGNQGFEGYEGIHMSNQIDTYREKKA